MTRQQRDNVEILKMLAGRWPRAFAVLEADRRPLKLGIRDDIAALLGTDTPPRLRQALAQYCNAVGYLRQCLPGATRRDLEGEPAGEVTGAEAANARYKLDQRTAKRVDPAKPAAAKQMAESATRPAPKPAAQPPAELTTANPAAPSIGSTPQPTGAKPRLGLAGLREAARHRAAGRWMSKVAALSRA
jgi:ProP effector